MTTHQTHINRAIDHVLAHLAEPLPLAEVARAAALSPFHFHRVFRAATGETLNQFITRLRLDRALSLRLREPRRTWLELALACGFASASDFTRCFKQRHGVAPSRFDLAAHRQRQREALAATAPAGNALAPARLPAGDNPDGFRVRLRRVTAWRVAYLRVPNAYEGQGVAEAAERLVAWAERQGVADRAWFGYMWDDPEVVPLERCRYDVAVDIGALRLSGAAAREVSVHEFPALQVAELELRGDLSLEQRALDWLFDTWLPGSPYVPADQPCFEAWIGRPFAHGFSHFELKVWLPVQRA